MIAKLRIAAGLAAALSLPHIAVAQTSPFAPPPPGTPVLPVEIPAHLVKSSIAAGEKPANRRVINSTTAQIDYRIDTFGPSGISRVEIHLTTDNGATWFKAGEDADMQSPATVGLPGEGVYGIRLAIFNGGGFGRTPRSGDRPQSVVEVDATPPSVTLQSCEIVPAIGAIDLRWAANDANLSSEPIHLYFRNAAGAPWRAIAQNVKNVGTYRWPLPSDIGSRVEFKVEAVDTAGNATQVQSPTPILLDQTEPEATVTDASAISRPGSPTLIPVSLSGTPTAVEPPVSMPVTIMPRTMPAALPTPR